jgi:MYXO-CTERM domain-containing protein
MRVSATRLGAIAVLGTLFLASSSTDAALVLNYQMGQAGPQTQDAVNTAAGGNLTAGAGLTQFSVTATDTYTSAPVLHVNPPNGATNLAEALTTNSFFTFSITVGSAVTDFDLTSLTFDAARGGAGTPRGYAVLATTPTTTDESIKGATDLTTVRPTLTNQSVPLSGFASLQNLSAGQTVTFRIPVYTPASGSSVEFDNIQVNANVTVPEPGVVGVGGLAALGMLARRRRSH